MTPKSPEYHSIMPFNGCFSCSCGLNFDKEAEGQAHLYKVSGNTKGWEDGISEVTIYGKTNPNDTELFDEILINIFSDADLLVGSLEGVAIQIARKRLEALFATQRNNLLAELVEEIIEQKHPDYMQGDYSRSKNEAIDQFTTIIKSKMEEK